MQFHFPRRGKWKWKRVNIPICLITSYYWGLFALATPTGGNRDAHTHTEHRFPHFAGTNPKHLSLQDPRFHFKAGMGHPKARKQPQVFWGWRMPRQWPSRVILPHTFLFSTLKIRLGQRSPTHFFQAQNIHFYIDNTAQTKAADISKLQSASIIFPPGKQTRKMNCRKVSSAMCIWIYGIFWMRAEAGKHNNLVLNWVLLPQWQKIRVGEKAN